jgi:hypothetical protein
MRIRHLAILAACFVAVAPGRAANVTVCTKSDAPGGVNLEQAIAQGGSIGFTCGGSPTIEVTRTISVTRATTLDGHRAVTLRLGPAAEGPMFDVQHAAPLTLGGLRLEARQVTFLSAAVQNRYAGIVKALGAEVTLRNTTIANATIPIRALRAVILDSAFTGNGVGSVVDSLRLEDTTVIGAASGFTVNGKAEVRRATFRDVSFGALSVSGPGCSLKIAASRFEANGEHAVHPMVWTACPTEIVSSHFVGNHGSHGGVLSLAPPANATVDVAIRGSEFRENTARLYGAAIGMEGPGAVHLDLRNDDFIENSAPTGGAIGMDKVNAASSVQAIRVTFRGNSAMGPGGAIALRGAHLAATQVVFRDNKAARGGALYLVGADGADAVLGNVILTGNQAPTGAAVTFTGSLDLHNATLVRNVGGATVASDLDPTDLPPASGGHPLARRFSAENSIFLQNGAPMCATPLVGRGNLQFPTDNSCGTAVTIADPQLDEMMVPLPGGAALAHGLLDVCLASPVSGYDFYGLRRPRGAHCSIGAVEGELESFTGLIRHLEPGGRQLPWKPIERPRPHEPDGERVQVD